MVAGMAVPVRVARVVVLMAVFFVAVAAAVQVAVTECVVSVQVSDATEYSIMVLTIASGLLGSR